MTWIRLFIIAFLIASTGCTESEKALEGTLPESSRARLIHDAVPRLLDANNTPGAAVAVIENGRLVLAQGYGLASVQDSVPFTASTRMNVASVSKALTSLGVLGLVQAGSVNLDKPVNQYLQEWQIESDSFDVAAITPRRLLMHTAGLGLPAVPSFGRTETIGLIDVLNGHYEDGAPVRVEHEPGVEWSYSGGGYTVLQLLIERIPKADFDAFMRQTLFGPLDMPMASFAQTETGATGYDESGAPVQHRTYIGASAAGLSLTAVDAGRLLLGYHHMWTGESAALDRETIREITRATVPVTIEGIDASYGLGHGVHRMRDGQTILYHTGGNPGFRAWLLIEPADGNGIFVGVNSNTGVPVILEIRKIWAEYHSSDLPPLF